MDKGLLKVDWNAFDKYSDEEITYFLYVEGKTAAAISKIRNMSKETVERQIIEGKIKYGMFAKSKDIKELFIKISNAGKQDKIDILSSMDNEYKTMLIEYIRASYVDMSIKEKENAIWILGECKDESCKNILVKASVHKHVHVRRMAVSAIGKIGSKDMENILIRALDDTNPQVVLYALKALKKIQSDKSMKCIDKIKKIYESTEKEYIKRAALEIINSTFDKS